MVDIFQAQISLSIEPLTVTEMIASFKCYTKTMKYKIGELDKFTNNQIVCVQLLMWIPIQH